MCVCKCKCNAWCCFDFRISQSTDILRLDTRCSHGPLNLPRLDTMLSWSTQGSHNMHDRKAHNITQLATASDHSDFGSPPRQHTDTQLPRSCPRCDPSQKYGKKRHSCMSHLIPWRDESSRLFSKNSLAYISHLIPWRDKHSRFYKPHTSDHSMGSKSDCASYTICSRNTATHCFILILLLTTFRTELCSSRLHRLRAQSHTSIQATFPINQNTLCSDYSHTYQPTHV